MKLGSLKMLWKTFLVSSAFLIAVRGREKRLFSFDYQNEDIRIDLDFSVPFISIPIKSAVDPFSGTGFPTINVNPASVALAGAVVMGTTVLLPLFLKNYSSQPGFDRYSRLLENTDFSPETVISFAHQMADGRVLRGCSLRMACWTEQEHYTQPPRILMNIASNKLLSSIVNATAIEDAMLSGRYGRDCKSFSPCPIQTKDMPILMDRLLIFSKFYRASNP